MNDEKINILVVEDESIVAMDIEQGLKRLGYNVPDVVSSGEEAIISAGQCRPDLILMDIQLKGKMDGIEASNEIKNRFNIPVIFLTAFADEATLQRAKNAEPYGYLLKPFEETELHTAIEIVLQKHKKVKEKDAHFANELVLSEERFKIFIDSIYDYAVFMLDLAGNIVSWNTGATRILGYGADEVIGKNCGLFYSAEDRSQHKEKKALEIALREGRYMDEGWRIKHDGSKIWTKITIMTIYDKSGRPYGFGKIIHDMTKIKETEIALKNALQIRDEFLSVASHELKTPLTFLMLQSQIFHRAKEKHDESIYDRERLNKLIEVTYKQVVKLTRLVEDMLDISRIRTGKLTMEWDKFDLKILISDVLENMKPQFIEAKCGVPVFIAPDESVFGEWDKERMEQVMNNLLTNALRYAKGKPVTVTLKTHKKTVQIEVKDQGMGIAKEDHEMIFEKFERKIDANEVSGLGLGLYIVKEIIQAHHGKIWVESELGKGATFFVNLPRTQQDSILAIKDYPATV